MRPCLIWSSCLSRGAASHLVHMGCGSCCRVALTRGLINCQGKTPEATMASALYTDVKRKQGASVFTRPQVTPSAA